MPRLSDTMEEGVLSQWVKHEGDQVRKGDVLAVIETDKAAMEMEAYDEGVLTKILAAEGASVPIAVTGEAAEPAAAPPPVPAADQAERAVVAPRHPHGPPWHRPRDGCLRPRWPASSSRERGIGLSTVSGNGPGGRIVRGDMKNAARERGARAGAARAGQSSAASRAPVAA